MLFPAVAFLLDLCHNVLVTLGPDSPLVIVRGIVVEGAVVVAFAVAIVDDVVEGVFVSAMYNVAVAVAVVPFVVQTVVAVVKFVAELEIVVVVDANVLLLERVCYRC